MIKYKQINKYTYWFKINNIKYLIKLNFFEPRQDGNPVNTEKIHDPKRLCLIEVLLYNVCVKVINLFHIVHDTS